MKYVMLYYNQETDTYESSTNNEELFIIAFFLKDDCYYFGPEKYYAWAIDKAQSSAGGNATSLVKVASDIELYSDFDLDAPGVRLSHDNFLQLVIAWQSIIAQKPRQVRLTLDHAKAALEIIKV